MDEEQSALFRKDSFDTARLLDVAIGPSGARLAIRVERLINERNIAILALKAIDRHVVGACESAFGMPEPCEECGEMREIAAQALKAIQEGA